MIDVIRDYPHPLYPTIHTMSQNCHRYLNSSAYLPTIYGYRPVSLGTL
jgi:hypothetical protein